METRIMGMGVVVTVVAVVLALLLLDMPRAYAVSLDNLLPAAGVVEGDDGGFTLDGYRPDPGSLDRDFDSGGVLLTPRAANRGSEAPHGGESEVRPIPQDGVPGHDASRGAR
jgi:hypothetical protein